MWYILKIMKTLKCIRIIIIILTLRDNGKMSTSLIEDTRYLIEKKSVVNNRRKW